MPLNPFIALILFLTSRELTINCSLYPDDPTIQYLYTLASHLHQNRLGDQHITDILAQVLDTESSTSTATTAAAAVAVADPTISENIDFTLESVTPYERGMLFVENYKHTRMQKGFKRMDWSACYSKGIELNLFKYKSADVLRNQFNKYINQQKKNVSK
ncbi:hypothetical protein BD770DRAFT_335997 [Pilaira anomala]|nr:hypothetical protein BD770DRAFT_335997 [Pilaira anomala]